MTHIYFVRHAEPDFSVHDDMARPLTEKGLRAAEGLRTFFADIDIAAFYSSPYKRAVQTIKSAAEAKRQTISVIPDFRERAVSDEWIADFNSFAKSQWSDFDFKLPGGESLQETQARNIRALHVLLEKHPDESIVVGGHGTAISTIMNYFDPAFSYEDFVRIQKRMPFVLLFRFDKRQFIDYSFLLP